MRFSAKRPAAIFITVLMPVLIFSLFIRHAGAENKDTASVKQIRENGYLTYIGKYKNEDRPGRQILIHAAGDLLRGEGCQVLNGFEGAGGPVLETSEEGFAEWKFNVAEPGLYNVKIRYFPVKGKGSEIERRLTINGGTPFNEAQHILFSRVWSDLEQDIERDNRDNDITPEQVEKPRWEERFFYSSTGYYSEPLSFYFQKGENVLRITSVKEPAVIQSIEVLQSEKAEAYAEIKEEYTAKGYKPASNVIVKIQGEAAVYKSDPTLYPVYDRSSPSTEPYGGSKMRLNSIGGSNWKLPGQWISWEAEVPEDGLYKICFKVRQNGVRGAFSNRRLTIDGKAPFKEAEDLRFSYGNGWVNYEPGGDEPYLFYLEKGKHEIKLEAVLGGLGEIIAAAEESVYRLNEAYRRIIMITGTTPDTFRDYQLDAQIPEVLEILKKESGLFKDLSLKMYGYTGQKDANTALLDTFSYQLADMYERPYTIPSRIGNFRENIGSVGAWVLDARNQPLEVDYILVASPGMELPAAEKGFFAKVRHELTTFLLSFFESVGSIGNIYDGDQSLNVWIMTGRDQAQILKMLIDDDFTPGTGIGVNLHIVQADMLLPATVAGKGPDVAMQAGQSEPVNYAVRDAAVNIAEFGDFGEIEKRFHESAITPFRYNGGVYALPETQTFPVLFYRMDIFEELGIRVPETWDELIEILPVIQKNHMEIGIEPNMKTYAMYLFQSGGAFYDAQGKETELKTEEAMQAFRSWTELYVSYKLPLEYNFNNRFRTGEMPVGISDYGTYNYLSVFAPDIRGLWGFSPVPGMPGRDGSIDRSVPSSGTSCMMMKQAKNKNAAWEFMKWWTGSDVQKRFGNNMESLLGAAARYPTANLEALEQLPWSAADYKNLVAQRKWLKGIPEVPGGYFISRHIENAFKKVVYSAMDPRETLLDYSSVIDDEITNKRREFGLDTVND